MIRKIQPIPFLSLCMHVVYQKERCGVHHCIQHDPVSLLLPSVQHQKKNKKTKPNDIKTTLLWMLPSRFCGCGGCRRSVQSSQTERAAVFFCCLRLIINAISTRITLVCLAVVIQYVYMHELGRTLRSHRKVSNHCRANVAKVWCLLTVCSLCSKIEKKLPLYLERQHSIQL